MKKIYTAFCLFIAVSICKSSVINAQVDVNDSLALVDLYNSTDGPHWYDNRDWLRKKPLSTWKGVYVYDNKVTGIYLSSNHLSGNIPESLGNLTKLFHLELNDNQLSGSIPKSMGNLTNLSYLDLSHNQLSGSIPHDLGNLTDFSWLYLNNNQLNGSIPSEFGNFINLRALYLNNNQLSGSIPPELSNLKQLIFLYLNYNQLSGSIPAELGNLSYYFETLHLDNNQLSGSIPPELSKLESLFYLYLNNNELSDTIPQTLGNFKHLWILSLSHNKLKGKIPASLSNLNSLKELHLRDNNLTDTVPAFLASLKNLNTLQLQFNHFTFNGIETLVQHNFQKFRYGFEKRIPVNQTNNTLSVYAGGTLSNNTYKWFNNGSLVATVNGDSTYTPTASGNYSVEVTNSIATELTLKSDTVSFSAFTAVAQNNASVNENYKSNLLVYPNPAKTNVTVSFAATGNYVLKLTDANGNILQTKTGVAVNNKNTVQLNVGKYAAGVYFITITNEKGQTQTLRLNKQ